MKTHARLVAISVILCALSGCEDKNGSRLP